MVHQVLLRKIVWKILARVGVEAALNERGELLIDLSIAGFPVKSRYRKRFKYGFAN